MVQNTFGGNSSSKTDSLVHLVKCFLQINLNLLSSLIGSFQGKCMYFTVLTSQAGPVYVFIAGFHLCLESITVKCTGCYRSVVDTIPILRQHGSKSMLQHQVILTDWAGRHASEVSHWAGKTSADSVTLDLSSEGATLRSATPGLRLCWKLLWLIVAMTY